MSSAVLDASALLAFLRREPGGERVEEVLADSVISTVSLAEVLSTALDQGASLRPACDAVGRLFETSEPHPAVFNLLCRALSLLDEQAGAAAQSSRSAHARAAALAFRLKFLLELR